jgi:hypothetical protein
VPEKKEGQSVLIERASKWVSSSGLDKSTMGNASISFLASLQCANTPPMIEMD